MLHPMDTPKPRDPASWYLVAGLALLLAAMGAWAFRWAWPAIPRSAVVGTYHRSSSFFLNLDALPDSLVLRKDGTMELVHNAGGSMEAATWKWDPDEHVVRSANPLWDRRIRLRRTLTGWHLSMRICATPFLQDPEEQDEEIDFVKNTAPAR